MSGPAVNNNSVAGVSAAQRQSAVGTPAIALTSSQVLEYKQRISEATTRPQERFAIRPLPVRENQPAVVPEVTLTTIQEQTVERGAAPVDARPPVSVAPNLSPLDVISILAPQLQQDIQAAIAEQELVGGNSHA